MKRLTSSLLCTVFGAASLFAASNASATLILELDTGSSVTTYTDETAGDNGVFSNGIVGLLESGVIVDGWEVSARGDSRPDAATGNPRLFLQSFQAIGIGSLTITLTEDGYGISSPSAGYTASTSKTDEVGTLSTETWLGSSAFDLGTKIADSGLLDGTPGSDAYNTSGTISPTNPFSFTMIATVTHTTADSSGFSMVVKVPEPATIALLGLGLVLVGFATRRRKDDNTQELAA